MPGAKGIDSLHIGNLMAHLEGCARRLIRYGDASRAEESKAAHARIRADLEASLQRASEPQGAQALCVVLIRALRLMFAQLKLCKLDSANKRLMVRPGTLWGAGRRLL